MNEPKWTKGNDIMIPGWYWKAWRGANDVCYLISLEKVFPRKDMNVYYGDSNYLYFYGPLAVPAPPVGDVWGV